MKTISQCATNGFIIIAEVGKDDELTGKFLKLNVSGALMEGPFDDPIGAMTAIEKAEPVSLAALSDHAYKGFFIVAELIGKTKTTGRFLVFTDAGVYKPPPHPSAEAAMQWIKDELLKKIEEEKGLEAGVNAPKKRSGPR